jgi:NodT family efflux transporter outer membrane factor (OMF) lipoprotein
MNSRTTPPRTRAAFSLALAAFLAACHVGPDYQAPEMTLTAQYHETNAALVAGEAQLTSWWRQLGDPVLDGLIERAAHGNLDIAEAKTRILEARALRGAAAAEFWPTLDADGSYRRRIDSENTPFGDFATEFDRYYLGVEAAWEIDLWGRVSRAEEAADADLGARYETARAIAVAVAAETATAYVELRSLQERLVIARENQRLQEQTLALVQARFDTGLVGERDLAQARGNVAGTRSRVPALAASLRTTENRLTVLLGLQPGALANELAASRPMPTPPLKIAVGVPADMLRRRPDIRAAERTLAAETARIGVAEADLYPRLSLFGSLGFESDEPATLFDGDSSVLSIGPSLRWNIFDAGRVRNRIAAQDARAQQAMVAWERSVLFALEEAENAMSRFVHEQTRAGDLAEAATAAGQAVELAQTQYREGLTDFQNVLDSERAKVELEDQLVQSRAAITGNLIALYRSLGGGWGGES